MNFYLICFSWHCYVPTFSNYFITSTYLSNANLEDLHPRRTSMPAQELFQLLFLEHFLLKTFICKKTTTKVPLRWFLQVFSIS